MGRKRIDGWPGRTGPRPSGILLLAPNGFRDIERREAEVRLQGVNNLEAREVR